MGWKDDEIDDFFREASGKQKVTYDEAYWKEMESLLDSEKSGKKRFVWWFFGAASVVAVIGIGYYFAVKQNALNQKDNLIVQEIEGNQQKLPKGEFVSAETAGSDSVTESKQKNAGINNSRTESIRFTEKRSQQRHSVDASESALFIQHQNQQSDNDAVRNNPDDLVQVAHSGVENETIPAEDNHADVETAANNTDDSEKDFAEIQNQNAGESADVVVMAVEDLVLKRKFGFYTAVAAGAGTSYVKSPNDLLVQWKLKVGFDYTIADRFRLGAGVGFRQQMINNLEIRRNREYYSLGLININQQISYDRLQFIDLNIHAHYTFRKMAIGIEFVPSYLISSRAKMDQVYEENGSVVKEGMTYSSNKQFVRSENFNPFGIDAGVSFQYEFKQKMCFELGVTTRLNKLLANNDFNGVHNQFPMRLELGLIKRF